MRAAAMAWWCVFGLAFDRKNGGVIVADGAKMVSAGNAHTCAVLDTDDSKCWGESDYGRLGLGNDNDQWNPPENAIAIGSGRKVTAVLTSYFHTCAVLGNSELKCFGYNYRGQLGYGDKNDRGDESDEMGDNLPHVDLGDGRKVVAVSAGRYHTCAVLDNSELKCFGWNQYGQLGYGDNNDRGDGSNEMGDNLLPIDVGVSLRKGIHTIITHS